MKPCGWEYPDRDRETGWVVECGAPATQIVVFRADGRREPRCLNHAQRDILGGQAQRSSGSTQHDFRARAIAILDALVTRACVQAGPGPNDRDVDYEELTAVCREAETLLYEAGWHRG